MKDRCGGLVASSCLTLCYPMHCRPPDSSDHGISQAGILEWVAISFFRGPSQPRDQIWVSCVAGRLGMLIVDDVCVLSPAQLFVTPRIVAQQVPLSMGFSRQKYWSRLSFASPGDLPDSGI